LQRRRRLAGARGNPVELVQQLRDLPPEELIELLPSLHSTGAIGEEQHALRDAAQAVLQQKLATILANSLDTLNESIKTLNRSTTRLTKVGWWLTIVVGIVGIIVSIALAWRS
jgi:hypothetical protein